jgi:hypothetical protein
MRKTEGIAWDDNEFAEFTCFKSTTLTSSPLKLALITGDSQSHLRFPESTESAYYQLSLRQYLNQAPVPKIQNAEPSSIDTRGDSLPGFRPIAEASSRVPHGTVKNLNSWFSSTCSLKFYPRSIPPRNPITCACRRGFPAELASVFMVQWHLSML